MNMRVVRRVELSGEVTLADLAFFVEQVGGPGMAPRESTQVELADGMLVVEWEVP